MESWHLLQPIRARAKQNCRQSIADKTAANQARVCIDLFVNVLIMQSNVAVDGESLKNPEVGFFFFFSFLVCISFSLYIPDFIQVTLPFYRSIFFSSKKHFNL